MSRAGFSVKGAAPEEKHETRVTDDTEKRGHASANRKIVKAALNCSVQEVQNVFDTFKSSFFFSSFFNGKMYN